MVALAGCLERGEGAARDEAAAVRWLRRAAARGSAEAARLVGLAYWWGRLGAPRDRARGAPYLLAAARRGDPAAMYQLALARRDGQGLARSPAAAAGWARRASEAGFARARRLLARLRRG
jgi:TPR repeat protein